MITGKSLHYYFQHFDFRRLSIARERLGYTKKYLAQLVEKQPSSITQFESGKSGVSFETFESLVNILKVHPSFLTDLIPSPVAVNINACHFRANRNVSQTKRNMAVRYAQDVLAIYAALERVGVQFPDVKFITRTKDNLSERSMEQVAIEVRKSLGLRLGPIHNMADLLEGLGIRIVLLPTECAKLDAFATWIDSQPCIMIAADSSASRMQFDYAHEFCHLLLDEDTPTDDSLAERFANRFAGAFLMPQPTFISDCPKRFRINEFISVKKFWHVSISAALYRARQLGIMPERYYKNGIIMMARYGIRDNEPAEFDKPMPTMLSQALDMVSNEISVSDLAAEVGFYDDQLLEILRFQRIPEKILSKMQTQKKIQPRLRLIK